LAIYVVELIQYFFTKLSKEHTHPRVKILEQ